MNGEGKDKDEENPTNGVIALNIQESGASTETNLPDCPSLTLSKVLRELQQINNVVGDLRSEVLGLRDEIREVHTDIASLKNLSVVDGGGDDGCQPLPVFRSRPPLDRRGSLALLHQADMQHRELIDTLRDEGFIQSEKVYTVMLSVNFVNFQPDNTVPKKSYQMNKAKFFEQYVDRVKEGQKVMYMFSNPYVAVCLALIVGSKGRVVTEGDDQTLAQVKQHYAFLIDSSRLVVVDGRWSDFFSRGYNKLAPYDVIIVPKHYYNRTVADQLNSESGTAYDPWDDTKLN